MNENKDSMDYIFFNGFSTQFPNTISKASTLRSAKVLSQEDSKFVEHIFQVVRETLFFSSNDIILHFMWPTFLKLFLYIILIF
jgi:hypothetical protein